MKSVHFNVSGLVYPESKTKLKNALDKIEGVQEIAVDVARGTVEVEFNTPADSGKIEKCIINTGYSIS
jgi:copper chaperone CopZ